MRCRFTSISNDKPIFFPYSASCCSSPSSGWLACTVRLNWRFWLMFLVYPLFSCLHGKAGNKEKKKRNYLSSGPSWNVQNGEGDSLNGREGGNLIDYNLNLAHSFCKWMHLLCKKVWVITAGGMKGEWIKKDCNCSLFRSRTDLINTM